MKNSSQRANNESCATKQSGYEDKSVNFCCFTFLFRPVSYDGVRIKGLCKAGVDRIL